MKHKKKGFLLSLIILILIGIAVATLSAKILLQGKVEVVVALTDLKSGTVIEPSMVTTMQYSKDSVHKAVATDINSVIGKLVVSDIKAEEPINMRRLAGEGTQGSTLSLKLEENEVAMPVNLALGEHRVPSGLNIGDKVNAIITLKVDVSAMSPEGTGSNQITTTMLTVQNKEILDIQRDDSGEILSVDMRLTPAEAVILACGLEEGQVRLAVVHPGYKEVDIFRPDANNVTTSTMDLIQQFNAIKNHIVDFNTEQTGTDVQQNQNEPTVETGENE